MSVKTYDPASTSVTFDGNIVGGFADGTFIKVTMPEGFMKHVGADGEVSRTMSGDESAEVAITLKQTSNSNAVLAGIYASDRKNKDGVCPLMIRDNLTNEVFAAEAWIKKMPDVEYGKEQSDREWVFDCAKADPTMPEDA